MPPSGRQGRWRLQVAEGTETVSQGRSVVSDPMDCSPPGSSVHRNSPGKNTGVGCRFLHQGIFPTQRSNPRLLCLLHLPGGFFTTSATWPTLDAQDGKGRTGKWRNQGAPTASARSPAPAHLCPHKGADGPTRGHDLQPLPHPLTPGGNFLNMPRKRNLKSM